MATYNNKHWLLSHIRNSFISTDDTGMCETIMLSDDLPSKCLEANNITRKKKSSQTLNNGETDEYDWYPGLDQSDDEDLDQISHSYNIQMDQDYGLRQRSNTAQKLEKMDLFRKRTAKIKNIKCDDRATTTMTEAEMDSLFERRDVAVYDNSHHMNCDRTKLDVVGTNSNSILERKLHEMRKKPKNKFQDYARFDGNQMGVPTKSFKIFLTMLPKEQQNYPMDVCSIASAKIQELIGLICYKCSLQHADVALESVENYGLYITEGDGEIDDFPPLDLREPCSKFRFSHLALVKRKCADIPPHESNRLSICQVPLIDSPSSPDATAAPGATVGGTVAMLNPRNSQKDIHRMIYHTTMMEAPLYRSYRVKIYTKSLFKNEIQLGISGEKLEIDPVQPQNSRFWSKQKPISHNMETVVWCGEVGEALRARTVIRIIYSIPSTSKEAQTQAHNTSLPGPLMATESNLIFRQYDIITNPALAAEIVQKINNIIDVKSSASRREYMARYASNNRKRKNFFSKS